MRELTRSDFTRGRRLKAAALAAPVVLTVLPALITFVLMILAATGPPAAAVIFFFGLIATAIGLLVGLTTSGILFYRHSAWTREMRERIAANGIRAEEIDWFRNELKASEKRALKAVEARDALLGDAYRETLASRLTATRIIRSSKRELLLTRKRQNSVRQLRSTRAGEFQEQIGRDLEKISQINTQANEMLAEAESRLQMIEAAASRGGTLADSELALKKLSARSVELPLALESAKMAEEIRLELEKETEELESEGTAQPFERMN